MTSLDAHMQAITKLASGKAGPEILSPLMENTQDPGPRALIYRNSGQLALRDALASNYPSLKTVMGDAFFDRMALSFADEHPPTKRSLVGYGELLPDFTTEAKSEHGLPWLTDMARLDRAWLAAHLAFPAPEFTAKDFTALAADPDALMAAKLSLVPSTQLVETHWQLHDLWSKLRAGEAIENALELDEKTETILIWRLDNEVRTRVLTLAEFTFMTAVSNCQSLAEAATSALMTDTELDISGLMAASVSAGLFTTDNRQKGLEA